MKQVAPRADGATGSAGPVGSLPRRGLGSRGMPSLPAAALPPPNGSRRRRDRAAARFRNLQQMRVFYRLSLLGSAQGRPAEIASRVLREFARTMGFRRAEIWLLDGRRRLS